MKTKDRILFIIVLTYPILDMIYSLSYKVLHVNVPINQFIRILILIYLLFKIKSIRKVFILFIFAIFLVVEEIWHINSGTISFISDLSYLSKLFLFIVTIYAIESLLKRDQIDEDKLFIAITASSVFICVSIVLSAFGLGMSSWDEDSIRSGVKGLFAVPNTVTATLLIIMPFCILMYGKTRKIRFLFNYLFIFMSLALIGTKSGLAGAILITGLFFVYWLIKTKFTYIKIAIMSFSVPALILTSYIFMRYINKFISEQINVYYSFGYNNIFSFLISNRDLQINFLKAYLQDVSNTRPITIFGIGYSLSNQIIGIGKSAFNAIEMDFYGVYYYSGIIVLAIIIFLILHRYYSSIIYMLISKVDLPSFCIFISLSAAIMHAFLGGHVIYDAMTSLYFGCTLAVSRINLQKVRVIDRYANRNNLKVIKAKAE